jgi:hypothetical protein
MQVYGAPHQWWTDYVPSPSIFLAGTIDMGDSPNWQEDVRQWLHEETGTLVNPRREKWIDSAKAKHEQITWELRSLRQCDYVLMYFAPGSKSPVSMLELGLFHSKMIVCCPEGFWRRENIVLTCQDFKVQMCHDLRTAAHIALALARAQRDRKYAAGGHAYLV